MSFKQLNLIEPVLQALDKEGYSEPTPIQAQAIPVILQRRDIFGCARTGTGKTAAFAIPVLQLLHEEKKAAGHAAQRPVIKVLVLTPTRELALQVQESFEAYGQFTSLRSTVIFGGVSQQNQVAALRKGVDILVATPGRLLDLLQQQLISLQHISYLILDEADRMLDMGFIHDVKRIIAKVPARRQTLFFSATMAPQIRVLADSLLKDPVKVEVTPVSSTAQTVQQSLYFVEKKNKVALLLDVLNGQQIPTALVFSRTKHGADKLAKILKKYGVSAEAIHGNKSQNARQRALSQFKAREIRVLVATDIAARGIDIDELTHVFNYELPDVAETYVHRIGRTGRAGASGVAISFCDPEDRSMLNDIQKLTGVRIPVIAEHPFNEFSAPQQNTPLPSRPQPAARPQRPSHHHGQGGRKPRRFQQNVNK
ncbi:MAG: DEAD/DEAH box helicase [Candidatus Pseudobacter hemicellulosilyticus]|uniref:DEAD-box ATP-dependent RNA helicase RhpA n=1 Tax=Candidatus Pseudobacter hemicellulosilyticus TaxID=3121375 RepID=A0AAJ6BJB4_9BACT|nr:MAG: DEAD/DEAH box helicase [Pseudobacter sp.]